MTSSASIRKNRVVEPDVGLADRLLQELQERTFDTRGVTRMSYGPGEEIAHSMVRREAEALGLVVETDAARNLYVTLPGKIESPRLVIGSHLDSVPMGGNYDGAVGVLMGLSVLSGMVDAGLRPLRTITVMAIRAEESAWFATSYVGSRASFGKLTLGELETVVRAGDSVTLGNAITDAGGSVDDLVKGRAFWEPGDVSLFLEPHIEQGPVLSLKGTPLGIVTDIRGSLRFRSATCTGKFAHSGTTPREARRDAVLAVSTLVVELDRLWQKFQEESQDLTVTVGQFETDSDEASFSKVAGLVRFSIDMRSNSDATLIKCMSGLEALVDRTSNACGVTFDLGARTSTTPEKMHPAVIAGLREAAGSAQQPVLEMPCGAGHDAATFASLGIPTGMLLVRNENGSHNPDEYMDMADFAAGADVLAEFCLSPPDLPR